MNCAARNRYGRHELTTRYAHHELQLAALLDSETSKIEGNCIMFYTFTRCDKRTFDKAFRAGQPVSMVKDPTWARENDVHVSRGFTNETISDPYQDGPSRPGEKWFYWVADLASATTVGPVEYHYQGNSLRGDGIATWRFWCGTCNMWCTFDDKGTAEIAREANVVAHAGVVAREIAEDDDDYQECDNCGDDVHTLSTRGWCDGCEEEAEQTAECVRCVQHDDGSVTTMLCPAHADTDPCLTKSRVTGKRRKGTIRRGVCTNCGWAGR